MYGIVTNGMQWHFLRWAGSLEDVAIEMSGPHTCEFHNDWDKAERIVGYIITILQTQIRALKNDTEWPSIKRSRTLPESLAPVSSDKF